jgi:2-polyprenyl-6-methoxyphenol hydroxylase-like FAD-dependent oxidoreductase
MPLGNFHVVIVGAGIAGLAASISLSQSGHKVTALDAAPEVAELPLKPPLFHPKRADT